MSIEPQDRDPSKDRKLFEVAISNISGGVAISQRDVGDAITIDDISDTASRFPGSESTIEKKTLAAYKNGFTEDVDMVRKLELMKGDIWKEIFGYAAVLVSGTNIEAIHPMTYKMGFIYDAVDEMGRPARLKLQRVASENEQPTDNYYYQYDGKTGFFPLKAFSGLKEIKGKSSLLTLVDALRVQNSLYLTYMKYAEFAAIAHPVYRIKDLDDTKHARAKADIQAPRSDKAAIIDLESEFYYDGPMAAIGTWDPIPMMARGDEMIAKESSLTMSQITGMPMGYLSASDTSKADWFDAVSQYQTISLPQVSPILQAIGFTKEIKFNDPYEPTFQAKMEQLKLLREATEGLIEGQQIVDKMNSLMGHEEDENWTLDKNYGKEMDQDEDKEDFESDSE